ELTAGMADPRAAFGRWLLDAIPDGREGSRRAAWEQIEAGQRLAEAAEIHSDMARTFGHDVAGLRNTDGGRHVTEERRAGRRACAARAERHEQRARERADDDERDRGYGSHPRTEYAILPPPWPLSGCARARGWRPWRRPSRPCGAARDRAAW